MNQVFIHPFDFKSVLSSRNRLVALFRMMQGYHLTYAIATASLGIAATSRTVTYLLLRYFIDDVLSLGKYDVTIVWVALGFIGLAVMEGIFSFTSGRLTSKTAEGITKRLRDYLFDHIQRLSFSYHSRTATGELIQRSTSDVDAIRRFYADQAINIGRIIILFTINFIAVYNLNSRLAWVSIIVIPIIVVMSAFFFKRVSKAYENNQEQEAVLSTTLQENLTGIRVVKAFARQEYEINKFESDNQEKFRRGKKLILMHSLFWPISDALCGLQMVGGFIFGATLAIQGDITVGTYMAYTGLIGALIFPMRNLGRLIVNTSTGLVSFTRVMDIIREPQEDIQEGDYLPSHGITGNMVFKNVGFQYAEGNIALEDVNFECSAGQVIALLGSTGSGKTTLVNLLPRFYDYTSGQILLDGIALNRYPRHFLRKHMGIVEQEPFLFSRSIRENITYGVGRDVPQEEVERAAQMAAIHDVIISFPDGYNTLVGERGVTLSGGQKQRVAIARTLLKNPSILIMDDSTSSVDTETEAHIREALETLMQNRTTFIIAHRIQSIMTADLILVFDKGRIVQKGTHEELSKVSGTYRQIYDIQTRIDNELEKEIASVAI